MPMQFGRGCPFSCPKYAGDVDYSKVATPVADAICDRTNLEIKVQPTSGPAEMKQIAQAIRKIVSHKDELCRQESERWAMG